MVRYVSDNEPIFGMANLNPQKAGLGSVVVWSDHGGIKRQVSHSGTPRVKLDKGDMSISITIEPKPKVLEKNSKVNSQKKLSEFCKGIEYVARNYDIFLKHYMDIDFSFDDEDFFNALRDRGEYK